MSSSASCPLPHVEEALRPYIHDRQETLRIRQTLADFFQSQFPTTEQQPLNRLNLAFPPSEPNGEEPPLELTGLRKKYLEAVKAQAAAKERRDALNAELNQLQRSDIDRKSEFTRDLSSPDDGISSHIALLHQRRRHRKLQILQSALDQIADTEPNPTRRDLQQWLKDRLGDAPLPPPESGSDEGIEAGINDQVLRLKKELLQTKHGLDEAKKQQVSRQEQLPSVSEASLEAQVFALRCARDELINWIEGELAKLAEQEGADEKALHHDLHRGSVSDSSYQEQVATLYDRYVSTRASLVVVVEAVAAANKDANAMSERGSDAPGPVKEPESSETNTLPPSEVLAYAPSLLQAVKDERALLQQTSYLRHELAKAQEENRNTLQRLANESHLVPPAADSALFWAQAAKEASKGTEESVVEQLKAGETSIAGAKAILAELEARKKAFNELDMGI